MKFELDAFNRNVTDEQLLKDLVAVDAKIASHGKRLTFRSYKEFGKYSPDTISVRFGSWNDALRRAGLTPCDEKNVPIQALFDNLRIVWIAKGKQPVYRDMNVAPSEFSASTYNARFGGWRKALEAFVAAVAQEQHDFISQVAERKCIRAAKRTKRDPSLSLRFSVMRRDKFRCVTCGRSPATVTGLILEIDHITPWSEGGETIAENLQTLCFDCNRGKGVSCG